MTRDEAKAILVLCRPGSVEDQQDPLIAEALGLLETDPELKAWFEAQQAFDARVGDIYNQLEPPAELKASILAGMRAHALQQEDSTHEPEGPSGDPEEVGSASTSPSWWRKPWLAAAAVFALLFAIVAIPSDNAPLQLASDEPQARQAGVPNMIQFLASEINSIKRDRRSFAKQSDRPETLQAYLASTGTPSPENLPSPMRSQPSLGCFTLDYNGIKMGMICFKDEQVIHLITARRTDCMQQFQDTPAVYEIDGQAFKVWVDGEQVYILSIEGSKEKLPKYI